MRDAVNRRGGARPRPFSDRRPAACILKGTRSKPNPSRKALRRLSRLVRPVLSALASLALPLTLRSAPAELPPTEGRFAFRTYAEEDGLGNLTIECLLQDRTGFLWVGTQDGLFRFDGSRFLRFGREEGLPSTRINCLHETADGRLYAGTRSGLARRL